MMFGYATNETPSYMPLGLELSHLILKELAALRRSGKEIDYLRPDAKSQVTIQYDDNHKPIAIDTIVVSTQHDDFGREAAMLKKIKKDVQDIVLPKKLFDGKYKLFVNPTGKFVIGGPHGDTGLTGRKIIVDTYGGKGAHGGGAFSGKDPSKVDRSAAYATRHIAKNVVASGLAQQCLVQVAYAIGVAKPVGLFVNTYGTCSKGISDGEIAEKLAKLFDMRPAAIIERYGLKNPIYFDTASYGHMGRKPGKKKVTKLDMVEEIKKAFQL
ncbi:UNVERIFIED_CONTAM: hypothetical protein GTU68_006957 [Idotea baltica]|nr:hypothetical protein [Idotea baltica]